MQVVINAKKGKYRMLYLGVWGVKEGFLEELTYELAPE